MKKVEAKPFNKMPKVESEKLSQMNRSIAAVLQGRHETAGVLSLFSRFSSDISVKKKACRADLQVFKACFFFFFFVFIAKIRKTALGSNDLSTLPLLLFYKTHSRFSTGTGCEKCSWEKREVANAPVDLHAVVKPGTRCSWCACSNWADSLSDFSVLTQLRCPFPFSSFLVRDSLPLCIRSLVYSDVLIASSSLLKSFRNWKVFVKTILFYGSNGQQCFVRHGG